MLKKAVKRILDKKGIHTASQNLEWIQTNCSDFEELATSLNADLWDEAKEVGKLLQSQADSILNRLEYSFGGGGAYPFLYFITRYLKPHCIIETGVALGYSSYSFLAAIEKNGTGELYSSDFPYFRIPDPEKYIGIVVDESLKRNWHLYIEGDELNLPRILDIAEKVDLFHYDSDKSYSGRQFAVSHIRKCLSPSGVMLMDDIQDNSFFYDFVTQNSPSSWSIFKFEEKFIGLVGKL